MIIVYIMALKVNSVFKYFPPTQKQVYNFGSQA